MDLVEERSIPLQDYLCLLSAATCYLSETMAAHNAESYFDLPERTPNGKLTGANNCLYLHHAVKRIVKKCLADAHSIEKEFNLRSRGNDVDAELSRPYSTAQWHIDLWTGEPFNNIPVIIPLAGDIERAGLDFGTSNSLPMQEFSSYAEALEKCNPIDPIAQKMRFGYAYLLSPACLHRSKPCTDGFRLSLDFRITKAPPEKSSRSAKYITLHEWLSKG